LHGNMKGGILLLFAVLLWISVVIVTIALLIFFKGL